MKAIMDEIFGLENFQNEIVINRFKRQLRGLKKLNIAQYLPHFRGLAATGNCRNYAGLVNPTNKADIIKKASGFSSPIFNFAPNFRLLADGLSINSLLCWLDL